MSVRIRAARETDVTVCVAIYLAAYQAAPYNACWDDATAERIIHEMMRVHPDDCFVAELEGQVVGFVLCSTLAAMRAMIEEFAVAPEYQGQGVGEAMLKHVVGRYRREGFRVLELIANRRAPAWEFYRKRGFREPDDYRLMSLDL